MCGGALTTRTLTFTGAIDYVFVDAESAWSARRALQLPCEEALADAFLPSEAWPSDHLAVQVELCLASAAEARSDPGLSA